MNCKRSKDKSLVRFHCPIVSVLKVSKPVVNTYKHKIWLYDRGDYETYRSELNSIDWNSIVATNDSLDIIADSVCKVIISTATNNIPNKTVTIRPNEVPWMNNEIRRSIRQRKKLHKQAKQLNIDTAWQKFRIKRNEVTKLIRKYKNDYQTKLIEQMNDQNTSPKSWFKLAKSLTQKQTSQIIPTLFDDGMTRRL